MSDRGMKARELFLQGYNCAQSVVGAYADDLGLPLEQLCQMSSAFGGGIGRLRETCGAVSGMALVIGLKYGYSNPRDPAAKKDTYALTQRLIGSFQKENGSLLCRELLGLPPNFLRDPTPEARTPQYYAKRPCPDLIQRAVDILEEYAASH